eukprot:CAMPEP_0167818356 /NCGR_PEP_ID=MMETSP0112_2-20121227/4752_1 /TAXON_ID=91324 /ORGANISM="Lotharella globosa, Strain CCCM811" /LENGTH=268 /DNA_ID=CAMNT_0007718317 /DNA_START=21 /DNA_END=824 /DNA_ORIENTATION=+
MTSLFDTSPTLFLPDSPGSPTLFLPQTPPRVGLRNKRLDLLNSAPLPPELFALSEQVKAADYFDGEALLLGFDVEDTKLDLFEDAFVAKRVPPLNLDSPVGRSPKRKKTSTSKYRVRKACDQCHFRKTKCDNQRPCGPCTAHGKVCTEGASVERRRAKSGIKLLADKLNRHQGQPCNRQEGCLRPFRHPGHCRKGPARKRKRKSKFVAAIEAAEKKPDRKLLAGQRAVDCLENTVFQGINEVEEHGSDVPEVDIQELAEAQSSQESYW